MRGILRPGEAGNLPFGRKLQLRTEVQARLGNLVQASGSVRLRGRVLLQADVTLVGADGNRP